MLKLSNPVYNVTYCSVEFDSGSFLLTFRDYLTGKLNGSTVEPIVATQKVGDHILTYCRNQDAQHLLNFCYLHGLTPTRFNIVFEVMPEGVNNPAAVEIRYHKTRASIAEICRKVYPRLNPLESFDGINHYIEFGKATSDCRLLLQTDKSLLRLGGYQVLANLQCRARAAKAFWEFARSKVKTDYTELPELLFQVGIQSWLDTIDPLERHFSIDNIIPDFVEKPEAKLDNYDRANRQLKALHNIAINGEGRAFLMWLSDCVTYLIGEYPNYPDLPKPGITPGTRKKG